MLDIYSDGGGGDSGGGGIYIPPSGGGGIYIPPSGGGDSGGGYYPPAGTIGGSAGDHSGAGGMVGGYSPAGVGNLSSFTGVGSASGYQSFTPNGNGFLGLGNLPFNIPSKPYRGLGAITSGGNAVLGLLNSIFGQYQHGQINSVDALSEATQLQGYLGDSSVFYQAKHGKDASALSNFKQQAQGIINSIASWGAPPVGGDDSGSGGGTATTAGNPRGSVVKPPVDILTQLQSLLGTGAPSSTNFQAPPNLFQTTPDAGSAGSGGNSMQKIVILAVVAFAAYYLYKKYA